MEDKHNKSEMKRRLVTLADGRYLIFYTFEDETPVRDSSETKGEQTLPEPQPETAEERHV